LFITLINSYAFGQDIADMARQTQINEKEKKSQKNARQESANNHESLKDESRRLLAELLGTFALTLVAAGGEVIAVISGGEVSPAARAVAPGLLIMVMIYTLGSQSGAHFNPVVTLAFTLRQDFP
jgi:aquaporin Z